MVAMSALVAAVPLVLLIFIVKIPAGTRLKTKVWIGKMRKQWLKAKSWTQITKNTHTVAGGNWKCHPCPPQGVCPTIWKQCFSLSWQTSTFHSSSPAQLKLGTNTFPSPAYGLSHFCLFSAPPTFAFQSLFPTCAWVLLPKPASHCIRLGRWLRSWVSRW